MFIGITIGYGAGLFYNITDISLGKYTMAAANATVLPSGSRSLSLPWLSILDGQPLLPRPALWLCLPSSRGHTWPWGTRSNKLEMPPSGSTSPSALSAAPLPGILPSGLPQGGCPAFPTIGGLARATLDQVQKWRDTTESEGSAPDQSSFLIRNCS